MKRVPKRKLTPPSGSEVFLNNWPGRRRFKFANMSNSLALVRRDDGPLADDIAARGVQGANPLVEA